MVTGAGGGIGAAVALGFAKEGADVSLVDLSKTGIQETAQEIRALGRRATAMQADISREDDVAGAVAETLDALGRIDVLVNNAAIAGPIGPLEQLSLAEWQRTLDVNLTGQYLCAKAVIPRMKEQGEGRILNVASILGEKPTPFTGAYNVTKAGNISLTKTLAQELPQYGISVICVMVTLTDTPMAREFHRQVAEYTGENFEDRWRQRGENAPLGRVAVPQDLVPRFLELACAAPGERNGEVIIAP
jgi:NAD(P)-dependent dehydrogenase (short-subunit alcohol dehydrogenase family)